MDGIVPKRKEKGQRGIGGTPFFSLLFLSFASKRLDLNVNVIFLDFDFVRRNQISKLSSSSVC